MYDIVKTAISNGITVYFTISDQEEDGYKQELTDWEKNNAREGSLPGKTITMRITKYFNVEERQPYMNVIAENLSAPVKTTKDHFLYTAPLNHIFSPPPNHLVS